MGSAVAQELALAHPERVERLVLIATSPRIGASPVVSELLRDGLVEGAWKQAVEARGLRFPEDAWELRPRDVDPEGPAWLVEAWVAEPGADPEHLAAILPETADVPLGTWIGALRMLNTQDTRARLEHLRVPTLVLAPIQDADFPEEPHQRELRAAPPRAREQPDPPWWWTRYRPRAAGDGPQDDQGHNLHWAAPDPVARDLAAFLRPGGAPTDELSYLELDRLGVEPHGALVLGPDRPDLRATPR
jgi:pimeloyl-ACP methyl ester carboxylesterase